MKLLTNHALPKGDVTAGYVRADVEALRPEQEKVTAYLLAALKPKAAEATRGKVVSLREAAAGAL